MVFLFETITLSGPHHFFYRVYRTTENTYFAEHFDLPGEGFHFHRLKDEWITGEPDKQHQVQQLGELLDQRKL